MLELKYKPLWLMVGFAMIVFVVYSSLTSSPPEITSFKLSDKIMHMTGYFCLMGWFLQIYQQKKIQIILAIIFISMGISLEFLQDLGGVRYFEVNDMLANSAGVLLAWSLVKTPFPKILHYFESKFFS